jgi:CysZ protein
MIFSSFLRSLGQLADPRFRRVLWLGLALSVALLVAAYAGLLLLIEMLVGETVEIPLVGPVSGLDTLLSVGSALFMLVLSAFLMVPVAAAFSGLFLDTVAQAVEDRHYPGLPPAQGASFGDAAVSTVNFFGVLVALNLGALMLVPFVGPFAPVLFWAVNGWLLGREFFTGVALRRMDRTAARDLRRRHGFTLWAAGTLMAAPLSIPLVNLLIPVLGAATFTHIFHALARRG